MPRSLKIFTLALLGLFLLVAGVDQALDHQSRLPAQNSFTWYNEKGETVLAYEGNLNGCPAYLKPATFTPPESDEPHYRWF